MKPPPPVQLLPPHLLNKQQKRVDARSASALFWVKRLKSINS
jgi:hypothetical protein